MSGFEPNKCHLRKLLIYFFNLKKSAAEAHRLFIESYGEFNYEFIGKFYKIIDYVFDYQERLTSEMIHIESMNI